jgi:serine/threonine-protein phosphatase 2A regulatory subunit B
MERHPVKVIPIHEYLRPKLSDLYENDSIFDKFECAVSPDTKHFLTGTYHNTFHVFDSEGTGDTAIEVSTEQRTARSARKGAFAKLSRKREKRDKRPPEPTSLDQVDLTKKVLHLAWHPHAHVVAVAGLNNLYLYRGGK